MRKQFLTTSAMLLLLFASTSQGSLLLTGVFDGGGTGGDARGVELFAYADIADLSIYGLGVPNNGAGFGTEEFTGFSGTATAGDYIYVVNDATNFSTFFGMTADYDAPGTFFNNLNGNDPVELFESGVVIDTFGASHGNLPATSLSWGYVDGFAYRNDNTGPDGMAFVEANWDVLNKNNVFDNLASNGPMPKGTYSKTAVPEPSSFLFLGLILALVGGYKKFSSLRAVAETEKV